MRSDRVAKISFPTPAPCGKTPLMAKELSKSYGSLEIFTDVDLAIDRGSRVVVLGLNGAGKTTLLRVLSGIEKSDTGEVIDGHGLKLGYYAQEHETLDVNRTVLENMKSAAPDLNETQARSRARLVPVHRRRRRQARPACCRVARRPGWRWPRWSSRRRTCCSSTSRPTTWTRLRATEVLNAIRSYPGAIVLVTHDEGAVEALEPERVLLLPDGVEDLWTNDYADLVSLA